ncbi:hypothetical protein [Oceanobacillus salinisoli]|uniref:hypothetical protein n=1 Tax=Oceanobacillus salinisoli TaxID=2678611 RepID=UPI0012E1DA0C|nr:hypothetical protein [Oceanobacillus salinisoli]
MKDFNLSFISGLAAFVLLILPFGSSLTVAGGYNDDENVRDDVYTEDSDGSVRSAVYEETVDGDVYDTDSVPYEVYEDDSVTDDVYDAVTYHVYDSVTGDVYNFYEFNEINIHSYIGENGDIVVYDLKSAIFPTNLLLSHNMSNYLIFNHASTYFSVELNSIEGFLSNTELVEFFLSDISYYLGEEVMENALTPFYTFDILDYENWDYMESSDGPITITFNINPDEVTNWDQIILRHLDIDGNIVNNPNQELNINKETGEVTVQVDHLGGYGLFELPEGENLPGDNDEKAPNYEAGEPESTEPTVTDDVYYTIWNSDKVKELSDQQGNLVLKNARNMSLFPDILKQLGNDKYIFLTQNNAELRIPVKALKAMAKDELTLLEMVDITDQFSNALSSVFQFNLLFNFEYYAEQFSEPF